MAFHGHLQGLHGGPGTGHAGSHGDSAYAAAFAMRTVPMFAGRLEIASWWTFSDLFEEGWLTGAISALTSLDLP